MSALRRARTRLRIRLRRRQSAAKAGRGFLVQAGYALQRLAVRVRRIASRTAPVVVAVVSVPLVIAAALITFAARIAAWIGDRIDALSAAVTPERALAMVGAISCVLLGVSQFVHYTAVEVNASAYGPDVGRVAPAPINSLRAAGSAHEYALIPVAIIALVAIVATLRGRWRLGRIVVLCGLVGVAITLLIDLPKGLDAGRAGLSFADSKAILAKGFYAELAASTSLVVCGALLGTFVRRAHPSPRTRGRWRTRGLRRQARSGSSSQAAGARLGGSRSGLESGA